MSELDAALAVEPKQPVRTERNFALTKGIAGAVRCGTQARCPLMGGPAVLLARQQAKLARGAKDKEHAMSQKLESAIAVIGIDIGKNSFHVVGHDERGAIVLRQKWSRGQVEARLANMPPCLIGMDL
jgi:hypothetical protein